MNIGIFIRYNNTNINCILQPGNSFNIEIHHFYFGLILLIAILLIKIIIDNINKWRTKSVFIHQFFMGINIGLILDEFEFIFLKKKQILIIGTFFYIWSLIFIICIFLLHYC